MMPGDYPMSRGGLLADWQIREYAEHGMIAPFVNGQVSDGISYGLSSYGYDVRLGNAFACWNPHSYSVIDPHCVDEIDVHRWEADEVILDPGDFILAVTLERLALPRHVTGLVCDKSSLARVGISLKNTVLEAGWEGYVTLEISNHNVRPVKIRAGAGIAQIVFPTGPRCDVSYNDRNGGKGGKYQHQGAVPVLPKSTREG